MRWILIYLFCIEIGLLTAVTAYQMQHKIILSYCAYCVTLFIDVTQMIPGYTRVINMLTRHRHIYTN